MARWTKAGAIRRMNADKRLREIMKALPQVAHIVDEAKRQKNEPGYNRILRYYNLKERAERFVGWDGVPGYKTTQDFDAVVGAIDDLLPPDDVDLYPDGKPDDDEDD